MTDSNSSVNRPPTAELLEENIAKLSMITNKPTDALLTTRQVMVRYNQVEKAYASYPRQQEFASVVDGGFEGVRLTYNNKKLVMYQSDYCPKNTMYGLHRESIIRYAPEGLESVQWFMDSIPGGGSSIWKPTHYSSGSAGTTQLSTVLEAPYFLFAQFGCTAPQSLMKISDLEGINDVQ